MSLRPDSQERLRGGWLEAFVLFLSALVVRLVTAYFHRFDGAYGQDAWTYIDRAQRVIDTGFALQPLHDIYTMPIGYPFAIAAVAMITGSLVVAAQALSLLCGAATAPVTCAIVRRLWPDLPAAVGWVAAGLVALSGQHTTWSIAAMSDVPATFFCALATLAMVAAAQEQRTGAWLALAGAALGVCWTIRWSWVAVAPSFAAAWLWMMWSKRVPWRIGWLPVATGIAACLPQLMVTLRHPQGLGIRWSGDWRLGNLIERSFYFAEGAYDYTLPMGLYYALPVIHPGWLTPVGGAAVIWGAVTAARNPTNARALVLTLLLGSALCNWLMLSGMPHQNFRYGMQIWLPLVPLAAAGCGLAWRDARQNVLLRRLVGAGAVICAAFLCAWLVHTPKAHIEYVHGHRDNALALVEQLAPGAKIYSLGPTAELSHRTQRQPHELFSQTPTTMAKERTAGHDIYLLYEPKAVRRWRTGDLPRTIKWLEQNARWQKLATNPPWTLWQLRWRQ